MDRPPTETPAPLVPSEPADDRISIQIDEPFLAEVDAADLARVIAIALAAEDHADAEVTLVITDDEAVAELNRAYRDTDGPTDVLSFAAQEPTPGFVSAPEAAAYLGDIIIALPFTRRQAAGLGRSLADELRLLAVHGTLHLLGYDHAEPDEETAMWARQDEILKSAACSV
ncbi:MAG: rRNA maturation RNase YbeY [Anaerolineae bacterium]|nr:rRNA maturation RNase YbeY [Anaerolineae bacterium]